MTTHRFYVKSFGDSPLRIEGAEAHHAIKVLRLRVGDELEIFDGCGQVGRARIAEIGKRDLILDLLASRYAPNDHHNKLHFAVALPKGERQRSTLEKLVELGVDSLIPLHSKYSVAEIDDSNHERLNRTILETCKQCERNRLLQVHPPQTVGDLSKTIRSNALDLQSWVLHPDPIPNRRVDFDLAKDFAPPVSGAPSFLFIIGPEGGFSNEEAENLCDYGAKQIMLGSRILRVETAVAVAATLGQLWLQRSEPKNR